MRIISIQYFCCFSKDHLQKIKGVKVSPFDSFEKVGHGFRFWDIKCRFNWAFH
jgi:hypothetical protein